VNLNAQMLLSMDRVATGQSPVLHETAHALLTFGTRFDRPPERRPTWLVEGHSEFVTKSLAKREGLYDSDTFNLGTLDTLHTACRNGLPAMQEFDALQFIGTGRRPAGADGHRCETTHCAGLLRLRNIIRQVLSRRDRSLAVTDLLHEG
jgi:hypothetical protein